MNKKPVLRNARPRFYREIPVMHKVRRATVSPSFRQQSLGEYTIIRNGQKTKLYATVEYEKHQINICLRKKNQEDVGTIGIDTFRGHTNFHRFVDTDYRGYNIGKLLFRLAEQEISKRGGKQITISTSQQDTITTALSLHYTIAPRSEPFLKNALGIPRKEPLPKTQILIQKLQQYSIISFPIIELTRNLAK